MKKLNFFIPILFAFNLLASQTLESTYDTTGFARGSDVVGDYLYLGGGNQGMQIFDISDRSNPQLLSSVGSSAETYNVMVVGNYAYAADMASGVKIIDITNPNSPSVTSTIDTNGLAFDVYVSGNYLYISDYNQSFKIYDISDPSNPSSSGSVWLGDESWHLDVSEIMLMLPIDIMV